MRELIIAIRTSHLELEEFSSGDGFKILAILSNPIIDYEGTHLDVRQDYRVCSQVSQRSKMYAAQAETANFLRAGNWHGRDGVGDHRSVHAPSCSNVFVTNKSIQQVGGYNGPL